MPKLIFWKPSIKGEHRFALHVLIRERMEHWLNGQITLLWQLALAHSNLLQNIPQIRSNNANAHRNSQSALYHVRHGNLSAAIRVLQSFGVVPSTQSRIHEIEQLHPRAEPPTLPDSNPQTQSSTIISEQQVLNTVNHLNPSTGIGPDAHAPDYLLCVFNAHAHQKTLTLLTKINSSKDTFQTKMHFLQ